ncbi:unnamed protein product [Nyctereutes procyonoides]|uniref:V-type proton ATPase subunit G n=1 Tax=Nyctereutes procyonoides TaxID=34880 RepID=A0A811YJB8_NYCPR|nr:unnamed protein product [Nyctereutes procyonoides]
MSRGNQQVWHQASRRESASPSDYVSREREQAHKQAQAEGEAGSMSKKLNEAAALGSHGSCSTEVEETQEKMTILQTYFQQNRDEILDNLLAFVCDIRPEIHENYCING